MRVPDVGIDGQFSSFLDGDSFPEDTDRQSGRFQRVDFGLAVSASCDYLLPDFLESLERLRLVDLLCT